ncbi:MAG: glycosyltransferase family 39 protein [Patescibacteria group bacterium]|nr:glycosyltransferase family 39 protein [Patescibacteria group bacterium]
MMSKANWLNGGQWIAGILLVVFLIIRLPGLSLPYHQDEWKTAALSSSGAQVAGQTFAHPPLTQIVYRSINTLFGTDNFRLAILLFAVLGLVLLLVVLWRRLGARGALFAGALFAVSTYSVLASLMLDTDGAIMPFFYLLALYFYDRISSQTTVGRPHLWILFLGALFLGLLVKLSFVLVIGAILIDFIWRHWRAITKKYLLYVFLGLAAFAAAAFAALMLIPLVYPAFRPELMISHAKGYAHLSDRNYLQSFIQGVKVVYYLSPLLIIPILFTTRQVFQRTRVFFVHLVLGFIFYFILFDFSAGALDKYLMFAIVPLAAIGGAVLADVLPDLRRVSKKVLFGAIIWSLGLVALNFLPHDTLGLYPKTEWFSRALHLQWNMLLPLTGGSGPLGFYVSFLFVAVSYLSALILGALGLFRRHWQGGLALLLVVLGLTYNGVLTSELLFGSLYGSAPRALRQSIALIDQSPAITSVITYNDSGAYELKKMHKYANRFYAAPAFEQGHRQRFADFDGAYLVVDMPHLYEGSFYEHFFSNCQLQYQTVSGRISGRVYNCDQATKLIKESP